VRLGETLASFVAAMIRTPRILVLERLFKLLESSVGIWIEPCRRRSAWKLRMTASLAYFLRITSMSLVTA